MTSKLFCFDMAGTTVRDDGLVLDAFHRVLDDAQLVGEQRDRAVAYVTETMGQSKIEVFTYLFGDAAAVRNDQFENHFVEVIGESGVEPLPGAQELALSLRADGVAVALTTGFSPATRETIIDQLGWSDLFPVRVSRADAGRGRPFPDMLWTCALRTQLDDIRTMTVIGDTASDIAAGRAAGAGRVIAVRSGTGRDSDFAGADDIIDSVADLLAK